MLTQTAIEKYFTVEKQTALLLLVAGAIALAFATVIWLIVKNPFWKGATIPAGILGLLVVIACYPVYKNSDEQRISAVYALSMNPDKLQLEELPRMQAVTRKYPYYHIAGSLLVLTGVILVWYYKSKTDKAFWYGFGCALVITAAILLISDIFAARRAQQYTQQLTASFTK